MHFHRNSASVTLAVVLSALLCAPAASASTKQERSQAKQIKTLKRQVKTLKGQVTTAKLQLSTTRTSLGATINGLNRQVGALTGQAGTLNGTIASLAAENTALRGSLSEGIAAIARRNNGNELASLVLEPALNNWICGGSKTVASYIVSFSFDGHYDDGSCL
jgi:septal ring factor EnvC (AmiA/AmiB activator)